MLQPPIFTRALDLDSFPWLSRPLVPLRGWGDFALYISMYHPPDAGCGLEGTRTEHVGRGPMTARGVCRVVEGTAGLIGCEGDMRRRLAEAHEWSTDRWTSRLRLGNS